ncbi:hypothetical protein [Streptomyces sp. G45]|uniref:hypothetical protein n=1 Tax=Streptomyces sp. G45 TaxID=3406627 RepID=UPI003C141C7C
MVPFAMSAVLLAGGGAATAVGTAGAAEPTADEVSARSCYGSARNYTSAPGGPGGRNAHWPGTGRWAYATRNCADINVKVNHNRKVKVCWKRTGTCQRDWTNAKRGRWVAVATNVRDGAGFYVQFRGVNRSTGKIAY